jgi:hypothetical protein
METKQVELESITVKEEVQQREDLNMECVEEYAEEIAKGTQFPPLVVFSDGENMFLADGRHRYEAYKLAGVVDVTVIVNEGGLRDAILHAVGANTDHGLRRTNADKRKAVITLLQDEEWKCWSDGVIADRCHVSQPFVSRLRNELTQNGFESASVRIGKDGRAIDVSNIGTKAEGGENDEANPPESESSSEDSIPDPPENQEEQPEDKQESTEKEEVEDKTEEEEKTKDAPESTGDKDLADETEPSSTSSELQDDTSEKESAGANSAADSGDDEESRSDKTAEAEKDVETKDAASSDKGATGDEIIDPRDRRIQELEAIIEEKDQRIRELEERNSYLEDLVAKYATTFGSTGRLAEEPTHMETLIS